MTPEITFKTFLWAVIVGCGLKLGFGLIEWLAALLASVVNQGGAL